MNITVDWLKDAFEAAAVPVPSDEDLDVMVHELNVLSEELSTGSSLHGNYHNCGANGDLFREESDALERSLVRERLYSECPLCFGFGYIGQEPRQRCPRCDGCGVCI